MMEQTADIAITESPHPQTEPNPLDLDDWETRKTVRGQERLETILLIIACLYAGISCLWEIAFDHTGGVGTVVLLLCTAVFLSLFYAGLKKFVFRPIRAIRYGRCARRLIARAESLLRPVILEAWKHPSPGIIALDPRQRRLFVLCRRTGFCGLLLAPEQIVDVKVERTQTVETVTRHGARMIFTPFNSFGLLGGGQSRSTATVYDWASLEISFVRSEAVGVERVSVDFGGRRQMADDWLLSLHRLKDDRS